MKSGTIWTIGHSNETLNDFISLLLKYDIQTLVDCRTYPRSRWSPQFNTNSLLQATKAVNVSYEFQGNHLGGLKPNLDYQQTIDEYVQRAKAGERIVVMCSEADPVKCHRKSMLTPSFMAAGIEVHHILWSGKELIETEPPVVQKELL